MERRDLSTAWLLLGYCTILRVVVCNVRLFMTYSLLRIGILDGFYCVHTKMDRSSICPRQVWCSYASGKAMILQQVPLLPSIKLKQHSAAVFYYIFFFLLASPFLDSSHIGTATFSKQVATTSFPMSALLTAGTFFVKVKKI